jgi:hypothetical protein
MRQFINIGGHSCSRPVGGRTHTAPGKGEALKHLTGIILAAVVFLLATDLSAFRVVRETGDGAPYRWKAPEVTYLINPEGGPTGAVEAIRSAMRTWNQVAGSAFTFEEAGTTDLTASEANDGVNVISFAPLGGGVSECEESGFQEEECLTSRNSVWIDKDAGLLIESDIVFNTDFPWSTTGAPGAVDVESTALHEFGHSLFLADVRKGEEGAQEEAARGSAMLTGPFPLGLVQRTLHADDMEGARTLYPSW